MVSLLRPWIIRDLELPRFGLELLPLECAFQPLLDGRSLARWPDAEKTRREPPGRLRAARVQPEGPLEVAAGLVRVDPLGQQHLAERHVQRRRRLSVGLHSEQRPQVSDQPVGCPLGRERRQRRERGEVVGADPQGLTQIGGGAAGIACGQASPSDGQRQRALPGELVVEAGEGLKSGGRHFRFVVAQRVRGGGQQGRWGVGAG